MRTSPDPLGHSAVTELYRRLIHAVYRKIHDSLKSFVAVRLAQEARTSSADEVARYGVAAGLSRSIRFGAGRFPVCCAAQEIERTYSERRRARRIQGKRARRRSCASATCSGAWWRRSSRGKPCPSAAACARSWACRGSSWCRCSWDARSWVREGPLVGKRASHPVGKEASKEGAESTTHGESGGGGVAPRFKPALRPCLRLEGGIDLLLWWAGRDNRTSS